MMYSIILYRVRYFVLLGKTLSYYKKKGDDKPAGVVNLSGNQAQHICSVCVVCVYV